MDTVSRSYPFLGEDREPRKKESRLVILQPDVVSLSMLVDDSDASIFTRCEHRPQGCLETWARSISGYLETLFVATEDSLLIRGLLRFEATQ